MTTHQNAVDNLSQQIKQLYERGESFRISHGSTNSTRPSTIKNRSNIIQIGHLSNVLRIDKEKKTIIVEPNVPMERLVEATLEHGLIPPVVMEFPGITVGGGYAGTSGESSSFKHGYFDQTLNWVEMILATGEVVKCSKAERPDLFHGAAGAVGSLGVTTMVEIQLIDAKKFVEVTYHPVGSVEEAIRSCELRISDLDLDYIDGILFSETQGAIITGRLTDEPTSGLNIQTFSNAEDLWYYLHVQKRISNSTGPVSEAIPIAEYCFRYDRGGFWVGASAFEYFSFPFNDFTRWWLDDFNHTRMLYTALHASGQSKTYIVQDLALPFRTAKPFIEYVASTFKIWPLWLCPLKQSPQPTIHPCDPGADSNSKPPPHILNIGLWGPGPRNHDAFVALNRDLESKLREFGGMKLLYAHTYYQEEEFWQVYPQAWYDALRDKYNAQSLPTVYDKVKVDLEAEKQETQTWGSTFTDTWPMGGIWAIKKAIESGTYVQARNSVWRSRK
ncbi:FAD-binding domain-containing protein [Clathrospora elynae]|uniref:Delta(24)-sterol reductase n=1 Tax=Clathrospora elynae TaxID=706981 RepID=A0A6A5S442_9PLEO|nr:FAD-binding domain-containing protein [Clathrospora elynae]